MKKFLSIFLFSFSAYSADKVWISVDPQEVSELPLASHAYVANTPTSKRALVQMEAKDLVPLSKAMHTEFHRCGGFFLEDERDFMQEVRSRRPAFIPSNLLTRADEVVVRLVDQISERNIAATIEELSAFKNRFHRSQYGKDSQNLVLKKWQALASSIPGASASLVTHQRTPQNSVRLIWPGSDPSLAAQIVVLGGHGDSINGFSQNSEMLAPGADDNASGIATITEVIRILTQANFQPKRSIHFFAYAAEEIGLVGSKEIARDYYNSHKNVVGVMQLDMTNFAGSNPDIVFMTDYTDDRLTRFAESLVDTYALGAKWAEDRCGYACSDHASWDRYGYPAVMPFESMMDEASPYIHTKNDTISQSGMNAHHAVNFAKLALAFVVKQAEY